MKIATCNRKTFKDKGILHGINGVLLLVAYSTLSFAQQNVAGQYNRSHRGDPQGASHLMILEQNKYIITFFGAAQIGTWKIIQDSLLQFTPFVPDKPFALYGRHNKDFGDSMGIFFNGFAEEETFILTGNAEASQPKMKRVFNPSPNCFSFPYVYQFPITSTAISFTDYPYSERETKGARNIYTFENKEKYNHFVAFYYREKQDDRPFYALIKQDTLYFDEEDYSIREAFSLNKEDQEFINNLSLQEMVPDQVFYNPYYNEASQDLDKDSLNYGYDAQKEAYINRYNYQNGEEYNKEGDYFNRMNIVYPYIKIKDITIKSANFLIDESPLFKVSCKD